MKKYKIQGYTLIELVIVMALVLVIGGMIAQILSTTLRGSSKSQINNEVSQNGNYALSTMTDLILNAQSFISVENASPTPTPFSTCVTIVNGKSITVEGFDGGVTKFSCDETTGTISSNSASLFDTTRVKLVPGSCSFTCTQVSTYTPPRIDITFQLKNANGTSAADTANATFNTSLSIRNYGLR